PERAHDVVGVDAQRTDEAVRVVLQRALGVAAADADQSALDVVLVHLAQRDRDGVLTRLRLVGDVLEHVLDRELVLVLRLRVLRLLGDELVELLLVLDREADHAVDDRDVGGHRHGGVLLYLTGPKTMPRWRVWNNSVAMVVP